MMMMPMISNHHQTCSQWLLWSSTPKQAVRPAHRASFKYFPAVLAGRLLKYKHTRQWQSFLESTTDRFDWFFQLVMTTMVFHPSTSCVANVQRKFKHYWPFLYASWFWKLKIKTQKNLPIENGGLLNEIWTPN